jgi:hypothetical protein
MILVQILVISILIAIMRGGRLINLGSLPMRWPAGPALAFAAQAIVIYAPEPQAAGSWDLHAVLLLLTYLFLLLIVWINRRIPGMVLLQLGLLLNLAAIASNGGYMPITPETMEHIGHESQVATLAPGTRDPGSKDIILPKEATHLWVLSDILVLTEPYADPTAFSIGDLLIAAGLFQIVQCALLQGSVKTQNKHRLYIQRPNCSRGESRRVGAP